MLAMALLAAPVMGWAGTGEPDLKLYYQRQDSRHQTPGAINALGVLAVVAFE